MRMYFREASKLVLGIGFAVHCSASYNTTGATELADSQLLNDPFPYFFPRENASPAELFAMPKCHGVVIEQASIDELQGFLASGKLTSEQLVGCYMQRQYQTGEYIK